jgi:transposase
MAAFDRPPPVLPPGGKPGQFASKDAFASYNGTGPIDLSSGDQVRHRLSRLPGTI